MVALLGRYETCPYPKFLRTHESDAAGEQIGDRGSGATVQLSMMT